VPKCLPMKKTMGGMRMYDIRFDRVGKEDAGVPCQCNVLKQARRIRTEERDREYDGGGYQRQRTDARRARLWRERCRVHPSLFPTRAYAFSRESVKTVRVLYERVEEGESQSETAGTQTRSEDRASDVPPLMERSTRA
jgi:hypothetical protein